jgi:hypothetical protein
LIQQMNERFVLAHYVFWKLQLALPVAN